MLRLKKAKDLSIGDRVVSYNHNDSKFELKSITDFRMNGIRDLYKYEYEDGGSVITTDNHKVVLEDGSSEEIDKADYILSLYDGNIVKTNKISKTFYNTEEVYDLEVKDNHNFLMSFCIPTNTLRKKFCILRNSRSGSQTVFSSVNFGTDTTEEGREVSRQLMNSELSGLGVHETPIFPITIFKLKDGINYNPDDPNYDLFQQACKTSAKRLFPNFSNLDVPFNNQYYKENDPDTEIAYMGCRTRVIANENDKSREIVTGRGNLSFTSINLPRLGINANKDIDLFFKNLDKMIDLVFIQLEDRLQVQSARRVRNYPFLMGEGVWIDSENLDVEDTVEEVLKHGTLTVGFIGLAECLIALTGKHHGESEESQELGLKIVSFMRDKCDKKAKETHMNYSLIATPSEGLSGRFVKIDKKKYGIIPRITDKDFYTNSFHIPVDYQISMFKKIDLEAPYHALTNGGHITYIEFDGDPDKNPEAFESIIRYMHDKGIGYGSINHKVDECPICHYVGIIDDECPVCGKKDNEGVKLSKLEELSKTYPYIKNTLHRYKVVKRENPSSCDDGTE